MLNMTYEYRIYPNSAQEAMLDEWLETNRRAWNFALAERKDWYRSRSCSINACSLRSVYIIPADAPRPTFASQCKALTEAKKTNPWLKSIHSQVIQQVLKRLEGAFTSAWEKGHGFPRFKKQGRMRSLLFPQLGKEPLTGCAVKLPGIGKVKINLTRPAPEGFELKQAQVVKRASGWYVMLTFQLDVSVPDVMPHGESLGIDLGLISFLATSTGNLIARPKFFVDLQRKLKLLQQRVSHKKLGSNNWRKAAQKVARLHEHITNTRKDFHYKLAHRLCNGVGMIFAEDLNLKAMSRGMLCKHTLDAGWGQFLRILEWVCWKRGVFFLKIDPNGTSQTCPKCQTVTGKKDLSERFHKCSECGFETDRDIAAAIVIEQRGLAAVGYTVKMLSEGKVIGLPAKKESHLF